MTRTITTAVAMCLKLWDKGCPASPSGELEIYRTDRLQKTDFETGAIKWYEFWLQTITTSFAGAEGPPDRPSWMARGGGGEDRTRGDCSHRRAPA